jgi:hypothetical protein
VEAIRTLVQMSGRGMRHTDDWCHTWILDNQFKTNLWKSRRFIPAWWQEAIVWSPAMLPWWTGGPIPEEGPHGGVQGLAGADRGVG